MADIDVARGEPAANDGQTPDTPKIAVTRTELVWPGKFDEDGKRRQIERVSLPFQVIERVNESRATRAVRAERGLTLFDIWKGDRGDTFEEGWRNKLIWGDNKLVMSSLLEQFAGKIDLIYIDPPFATGADFGFDVQIGEEDLEVLKEQSAIEEKAYRDTWGSGRASFIDMLDQRLRLMRDLLSPSGSIFVHLDWHMGHYVKILLDEIFGEKNLRNEIIWWYFNKMQGNVSHFPRNHDTILYYVKSVEAFSFTALMEKRDEPVKQLKRKWDKESGKLVNVRGADGKVEYQTVDERRVDDVWRLPMIQPADRTENTGFPTQKREEIVRRVIECATQPGALIADFFCGSGTTLAAAEKLDRRWVGADLGRYALHVTRKRLLGIENCHPFEVLNLGKYERRYWQVATFGEDLDDDGVISLYEYVAFILKLYGATPTSGLEHLHGRLGNAFVHVGAVDAPVTLEEVAACVDECVALRADEVHMLGWEWEMGMNDLVSDEAKRRGVKVVLRQIPREVMEQQATEQGDIRFFELAYLEARSEPVGSEREYLVELENFVIPNPELVPDEMREKITRWSDYVDYWAVDWDFRDDTFMQGWVTYRTRKDRKLELKSAPHTYEEPGEYSVMVKVIDVFGNDTSSIIRLTVD
jgi:adenine-specific DNA-methyltransferase